MMFQSIVKYFCERKFDFVIEGNIYPSFQSKPFTEILTFFKDHYRTKCKKCLL